MIRIPHKYKLLTSLILVTVAGFTATLGFAPFNLWYIPLISLTALWWTTCKHSSPLYAALFALLFFFCMHISTLWWITSVMTGFGQMSIFLALLTIALFSLYLSLFPALAFYASHRLCAGIPTVRSLILAPALLSLAEIINSVLFTGFSWDMLGYTQIDSILSGYAPLFGVQGISLIMFVTAAYLAYTFIRKNIVYVTVPAILMITAAPLSRFSYIEEGNPMKVALVQGNVNTTLHWDPNHIWKELQIYYDEFIANLDTEIMIWPESAIPDLEHNMEKLKVISTLDKAARSNGIGLITGIQYYDDKNRLFFNSMLGLGVIDRQKNIKYKFGEGNRYYKRHLVPIGEFVPFEWLLRQFGPIFNMPMSSFTRGSRNQPNIIIQDLKVASAICYEMAYNTELREQIYDNTNLIVTVSNDGWFNYTNGPVQHLFIARMRAREFGKPVLRATNNGITAVIDSDGRIVDTIPENITATLRTEFRPTYGETPFKKFGLMWVYLYIGSALLFAFLRKMKYKKIIASRPSQEWPE